MKVKNNLNQNHNILVSPNPANKILNLAFSNYYFPTELKITDISGSIIHQQSMNIDISKIDISNLKEGVYLLNFILNSGEKITKKIVVTSK